MTQSRSGSAVVLASAAGLVAGLALWIAGQPSPALRTERGSPSPATASPTSTTVDPFAALEAIGMVPATPTARGRVAPDTALVLEATLRAASATCEEPEDGRCHAGCFRFVVVALDSGAQDLVVRVSSPEEPGDVLAESLVPGPRVDAGFCYGFAPGEGSERPVRIEVRARVGAGEVAVAGWREREPEEPPPPPAAEEPTGPWITGEPLPVDAGTTPAPNTVRWMAADPHVPLAEVVLGELREPPDTACTDWPARRHRWVTVDAWGQPVGTVVSVGAEGYDVTECYEMRTAKVDGEPGMGLLASIGYRPGPSARDTPSEAEREALRALLDRVDAVFGAPEPVGEPLYFHGRDQEGAPTRNAVVGGRVLVVAQLVEGAWELRHIELAYGFESWNLAPYRPLAVLDLDLDGNPEIVFRESELAAWNDSILVPTGIGWVRAIESVGGATI